MNTKQALAAYLVPGTNNLDLDQLKNLVTIYLRNDKFLYSALMWMNRGALVSRALSRIVSVETETPLTPFAAYTALHACDNGQMVYEELQRLVADERERREQET